MSFIDIQIQKLKELANDSEIDMYGIKELQSIFKETADILETLSSKLTSENMEFASDCYKNGWIPCNEKTPDIIINNKYSDEVLAKVEWWTGEISYDVTWYTHYGYWHGDSEVRKVIAWKPFLK